jgi:hypothetical protein
MIILEQLDDYLHYELMKDIQHELKMLSLRFDNGEFTLLSDYARRYVCLNIKTIDNKFLGFSVDFFTEVRQSGEDYTYQVNDFIDAELIYKLEIAELKTMMQGVAFDAFNKSVKEIEKMIRGKK